jgi:tetratricopeptide (TPR) repeat protein
LEVKEKARQDADRFRELEEQLPDQLAGTTPIDERVGVTDSAAAEATWKAIQEVMARWEPGLANFPEESGRASIQKAYAELVLWRVQSLVAQPLDSVAAEKLLEDLESIAMLRPAPHSYSQQRLRAACLEAAGMTSLAEQALKRSEQFRRQAFDYFLEGEQKRMEALANASAGDGDVLGRPSRAFLREAAELYQKSIELDPQSFWAHLQKGRSHLVHREEIDEGLAELNLAVALRPESRTRGLRVVWRLVS